MEFLVDEHTLFAAGLILGVTGYVMILIKAFQEHLIWGTCCLLFPPVPVLIFAFMNLDKCWFALGLWFAGIPLVWHGLL